MTFELLRSRRSNSRSRTSDESAFLPAASERVHDVRYARSLGEILPDETLVMRGTEFVLLQMDSDAADYLEGVPADVLRDSENGLFTIFVPPGMALLLDRKPAYGDACIEMFHRLEIQSTDGHISYTGLRPDPTGHHARHRSARGKRSTRFLH